MSFQWNFIPSIKYIILFIAHAYSTYIWLRVFLCTIFEKCLNTTTKTSNGIIFLSCEIFKSYSSSKFEQKKIANFRKTFSYMNFSELGNLHLGQQKFSKHLENGTARFNLKLCSSFISTNWLIMNVGIASS